MPASIEILNPNALQKILPLSAECQRQIQSFRETVASIIQSRSSQLLVITGPCSIDDESSALEYATRLKELQLSSPFLLCMRVYCEKPRSRLGWKGYAYPDAMESDPFKTILRTRSLMLKIASMGIPIATEFLDPFLKNYYQDLVSWGSIGARTALSQVHRQLASGCDFPVGIKNTVYGQIDGAINGVYAASKGQEYFALNEHGNLCLKKSAGNPYAHVVLRGGISGPNNTEKIIKETSWKLEQLALPSRIILDCSHGNSTKENCRQGENFKQALHLITKGNQSICALMLESYLEGGRQSEDEVVRRYGVSITDPCLSWEETAQLLTTPLLKN